MTKPGSSLPPVYEAFLPREHALYRPRHARRQMVALVCAAVFFATPALSAVFGARPGQFENRALTPFPSLSEGWGFFSQLGHWATDHLVFREQAVHSADAVSRGVFGEPPPLDQNDQQGPLQVPASEPPDPRKFPAVLEGKDGWLYLGDEVASHCSPATNLRTTFDELQRFRAGIEASGRQLVVLVAPDKMSVVPEHLPDSYLGKDCHDAAQTDFWHRVDQNQDFMIDLRQQLRTLGDRQGAPVYGPQDAHWSDEGSIAATRAVAERLRPGISSTWKTVPTGPWQQSADLPPLIGRTGLTSGTHYTLEPDGAHDEVRQMPSEFTTPVHASSSNVPGTYGLRVAWLGDSFTIRTLPYLAAAFRDLTALHTSTADHDLGAAAATLMQRSDVVVLELAERSLIGNGVSLLEPKVQANVFGTLDH